MNLRSGPDVRPPVDIFQGGPPARRPVTRGSEVHGPLKSYFGVALQPVQGT